MCYDCIQFLQLNMVEFVNINLKKTRMSTDLFKMVCYSTRDDMRIVTD